MGPDPDFQKLSIRQSLSYMDLNEASDNDIDANKPSIPAAREMSRQVSLEKVCRPQTEKATIHVLPHKQETANPNEDCIATATTESTSLSAYRSQDEGARSQSMSSDISGPVSIGKQTNSDSGEMRTFDNGEGNSELPQACPVCHPSRNSFFGPVNFFRLSYHLLWALSQVVR